MQIVSVDERDSTWERHDAAYRVCVFSGGDDSRSWAKDAYDMSDVDAVAVIAWAESRIKPGDLYAIALREGVDSERGLIWLVECDINSAPIDEQERMLQRQMVERSSGRPCS